MADVSQRAPYSPVRSMRLSRSIFPVIGWMLFSNTRTTSARSPPPSRVHVAAAALSICLAVLSCLLNVAVSVSHTVSVSVAVCVSYAVSVSLVTVSSFVAVPVSYAVATGVVNLYKVVFFPAVLKSIHPSCFSLFFAFVMVFTLPTLVISCKRRSEHPNHS